MLQKQVGKNNKELISFLLFFTAPGIKVAVDFIMAWGESDSMMLPCFYIPIVKKWTAIMFKAEVEVLVRVPTKGLDFWVDYLVSPSHSI